MTQPARGAHGITVNVHLRQSSQVEVRDMSMGSNVAVTAQIDSALTLFFYDLSSIQVVRAALDKAEVAMQDGITRMFTPPLI